MKIDFSGRKNKWLIFALPACYLFIALFAPLLANDQPLYLSVNGKQYFPAFSSDPYIDFKDAHNENTRLRKTAIDWKNFNADITIFPPICWSASQPDLLNTYVSPFSKQLFLKDNTIKDLPFRFRHFLGTGKTGNDLLSGLIHGTRTSIMIGLFSVLIALFIGISLGGIAGYFGDHKLRVRRGCIILFLVLILPAWFYSFQLRYGIIKNSFHTSLFSGLVQIFISFLLFMMMTGWSFLLNFKLISILNEKIFLPIDAIISRFIEIFLSLPRLILILTVAAILKPSVASIILIIGFTSWTETARLMRAQVLSLREMNYITAAKSYGVKPFKIIFSHLLPNAATPIVIVAIFGIASAILTEAGLSFLGIGVPPETATWGSLMYEARENFTAWWLVVFSGLALFILLSYIYMLVGIMNKKHSNS
jgi:peptide/nickel transport system permease protein